jgi:hypothetical protein
VDSKVRKQESKKKEVNLLSTIKLNPVSGFFFAIFIRLLWKVI